MCRSFASSCGRNFSATCRRNIFKSSASNTSPIPPLPRRHTILNRPATMEPTAKSSGLEAEITGSLMKLLACSWFRRSSSTCARRSPSEHTLARKDALSEGACCRTASNKAFARCHFSGVISMTLFQCSIQIRFRARPFAPDRCRGNTQYLRSFFNRQATEVAKLHNAALPGIKPFQSLQTFVERKHLVWTLGREEDHLFKRHIALPPAALGPQLSPRVIHQNTPHQV